MLTKIENINLSNNITKCKVSADNTCGLLHALGEITPANVTSTPTPDETIGSDDNDELSLPVTSFACKWKPPRKRKCSQVCLH